MDDDEILHLFSGVDEITPTEFELAVKRWFDSFSGELDEFRTIHKESVSGVDGNFEIDVSIRFRVFGEAQIHVLAECKKHTHPIKRDVVQILNDRLRSTGGHKGIIFSTSPFQSGALTYAEKNGIALVQIADGRTAFIRATGGESPPLPDGADKYIGWNLKTNSEGNIELGMIKSTDASELQRVVESAT